MSDKFLVVIPEVNNILLDANSLIKIESLPLTSAQCRKALKAFSGTSGSSGSPNWLTVLENDMTTNHSAVTDDYNILYDDFWDINGTMWSYVKSLLVTQFGWDSVTADTRITSVINYALSIRSGTSISIDPQSQTITSAMARIALNSFFDTAGAFSGTTSWLSLVNSDMVTNHAGINDNYNILFYANWPVGGVMWLYARNVLKTYFGWSDVVADARMFSVQSYALTLNP